MNFPQNIIESGSLNDSQKGKLLAVFNSLENNYIVDVAFSCLGLESSDSNPGAYYYAIRRLTKACALKEVQEVLGGPNEAIETIDLLQNLMDFIRVCDGRDFECLTEIKEAMCFSEDIDELHHQTKQRLIERLKAFESQSPA